MNSSKPLSAEAKRVIDADNSGPSFSFDAKCYPDANDKVMKWLEEQAKKFEVDGPSKVTLNKDGTPSELVYEWGDTRVSLKMGRDGFDIYVSGDGEEIDLPALSIVEEGRYVDDQYEVFVVKDGQRHDLDELFDAFKQLHGDKSAKSNAGNPPSP